jgi:tetratricopeptide (TPR) repeat protein
MSVRLACCLALVLGLSACARAPLRTTPAVPAGPTPTERLAAADRLVRTGCLDCLIEAYREYQSLRSIPPAGYAATLGAIRAAGLIALRQRELGMVDEGYVAAARDLAAAAPDLPAWIAGTLDVVDVLPPAIGGVSRPPSSDADLEKNMRLRKNSAAYTKLLRDFSELDELSAYAWASFACGAVEMRDAGTAEIFGVVSTFRDTPLLAFKEATCRGTDATKLTTLADGEPRFVETAYLLGLREVGRRKLDEADVQFARAYAWHPRWPALTQSMANVAMTAEEFEKADRLYGETLTADPRASDALLGKVKALTYLGKAVDAIAAVDQLLGERWHVGDGRYWRALNENQLSRFDEAWTDVEAAAKLLINAEVPKLAGIIAYRRQQLEVSRAKFEESRLRNPVDCETAFYLGVVLGDQRAWARTADVLREAVGCLEAAELEARADIAAIRASADPPERQARQIARREARIAEGRRMIATSWYNTAVAYFSMARRDEARQFAEKVAEDGQFGERAKEILARLAK